MSNLPNHRLFWSLVALSALAASVRANIVLSVDILDGNDAGAPAPAGMIVVDISVMLSDDDFFIVGAVAGSVANDARLVYSPDPNNVFRPPGLEHRYVSFASAAFDRNDTARFAPAGTISEQSVITPTGYCPPDSRFFAPSGANTAFLAIPMAPYDDPDAPLGRDGYVLRIALDVSGVTLPGADDPARYRIFDPASVPSDYAPVFVSDVPCLGFGTTASSFRVQDASIGMDWGVYVPEPCTCLLLCLGGAAAFRRN